MDLIINEDFRDLIPILTTEEFGLLTVSITNEGCRDPIVVWGRTIVDGHNRYDICRNLNIPFKTINLDFIDEDDAKRWIIKNQFGRRNLTPFQRAELALKLEPLIAEKAKEKQVLGGEEKVLQNSVEPINTQSEVARAAGISHDTIHKAKVISLEAAPEIKDSLRKGETSIHAAYMDVMRQRRPHRAVTPPPPEGKYRCIVIDPPWPVVKIEREERPNQGVELDYSTLSIDEIKDLKIPADDMCHIYLWVTQKYLPAGIEILRSWGFKYQCVLTWVKKTGMTPFSWMYNTEHVLFGTRGGLPLDKLGIKLAFEGESKKHSKKPDEFYEIVRQASPGPRIDMFAREARDGFDVWGFEAPVGSGQGVVGQVHT